MICHYRNELCNYHYVIIYNIYLYIKRTCIIHVPVIVTSRRKWGDSAYLELPYIVFVTVVVLGHCLHAMICHYRNEL